MRAWLRRHQNVLVVLAVQVALFGTLLFWTARNQAAYQAAQRRDQAQQARQGRVIERKICTSFGRLAGLSPPAGAPGTNPSRAYLQGEHAILVGLGTDLGCKGARR